MNDISELTAQPMSSRARIVKVESHAVWVESIDENSCSGCSLKPGCGHSILQSFYKAPQNWIEIPVADGSEKYKEGDSITFYVPAFALQQSSVVVYLCPLLCFLVTLIISHAYSFSEGWMLLFGAISLCVSVACLNIAFSSRYLKSKIQPYIL
jgi:sigma-E factor negative regulatory protein RseC